MATSVNTFEFIPSGQRIMYESAFNAITQLELWGYMKNFKGESFMFSKDKEVENIYKKIEDLGYVGHSGGSFGCIMRDMEFIAKYGINRFEEDHHAAISARLAERSAERQEESNHDTSNLIDTE